MDLTELRRDAEALWTERARDRLELESGRVRALAQLPDRDARARRHPLATGAEALPFVLEAREKAEGRRRERLGALAEWLLTAAAETAARAALAEEDRLLVGATVAGAASGEAWSLSGAIARLPAIEDPDARQVVELRVSQTIGRLDAARARVLEATSKVVERAGLGSSPPEAHAKLLGLDLPRLQGEAEGFLAATEAAYFDLLSWWLPRTTGARPFPQGARRADLLRAMHLAPFAGAFPRSDLLGRIGTPLSAAGLHPLAEDRIRIDAREIDSKAPGVTVHPLDPPARVVLVRRATGGAADLRAMLRGLGESLFHAHVEAARPVEDRLYGDGSLPLGLGVLFERLALDRAWLSRVFQVQSEDLVRAMSLAMLTDLRRDAALLAHERDLFREGPTAAVAGGFAERMSRTLGGEWPRGLFLWDARAGLETAFRLRAAGLEAALFDHVRDTFDEDWWRNPRAMTFVKGLALGGRVEPAHVLAKRLEFGTISLERAARRLTDAAR
jgi:hypothetical protein